MTRLFLLIFLIAFSVLSYAQNSTYEKADSIASLVSKSRYKKVTDLTMDLIRELESDEEKYRAIVKWISLNVEYKLGSVCRSGADVLKKKKAVCAGYSMLVKEMCDFAGIPCEIIVGDAKVSVSEIGAKINLEEHAWNKVYLNGKWQYSDVTWVTSSYDRDTKKYIYNFNEDYYLADPLFFNRKHYPEKEEDFIMKQISKREYRNLAIPLSNFNEVGKTFIEFPKGKISRHYKLKVIKKSSEIQLVFKENKYYTALEPDKFKEVKSGNVFIFNTKSIPKGSEVFIKVDEHYLLLGRKI